MRRTIFEAYATMARQVGRNHFVNKDQMLELDTSIITPGKALAASGYVKDFDTAMSTEPITGYYYGTADIGWSDLTVRLKQNEGVDACEKPETIREWQEITSKV